MDLAVPGKLSVLITSCSYTTTLEVWFPQNYCCLDLTGPHHVYGLKMKQEAGGGGELDQAVRVVAGLGTPACLPDVTPHSTGERKTPRGQPAAMGHSLVGYRHPEAHPLHDLLASGATTMCGEQIDGREREKFL